MPDDQRSERGEATDSLRALLITAGLTEAEADGFIKRLQTELLAGSIVDKVAIERFIHSEIDSNLERSSPERKKLGDKLKKAVFDLFIAASGAAIWEEVIKPAFLENKSLTSAEIAPQHWARGEIAIEWWVRDRSQMAQLDLRRQEPALRNILEFCETTYGAGNQRTAFFLDALGMCLDLQGRHTEARRLRSTALKITETLYGPYDRRTGTLLSNLGVCLAAQGRYRQAVAHFQKGLQIIRMNYAGTNNIPAACVTLNLYEALKAQGKLPRNAFSFVISDEKMLELAKGMMALKVLMVLLESLVELMEHAKMELAKAAR